MLLHQDVNHGPASYKNLKPNELLVTKIFHTIQGEGPYTGMPAVFLRLAGCNRGQKEQMGCAFCETDFRFDKGMVMTFEEMGLKILSLAAHNTELIVITGGEPMMQDNLVPFLEFMRKNYKSFIIQIESNGDRLAKNFTGNEEFRMNTALVVSPKVNKSGQYTRPDERLLAHVDYLKFLISATRTGYTDVPQEYVDVWLENGGEVSDIYISPITKYMMYPKAGQATSIFELNNGINIVDTYANYKYATKLALEKGYRISLQTHLFLGVE